MARRTGLENVSGLGAFEETLVGGADGDLERIMSAEHLVLLLGGDPAQQAALQATLRERYFDLTPWSWGVLTNTRDGGLRVDLTAGLEQQQRIEDDSGELVPLWQAEADGFELDGPTWERIRGWYQLRDQIIVAGGDAANARIEPVSEWASRSEL